MNIDNPVFRHFGPPNKENTTLNRDNPFEFDSSTLNVSNTSLIDSFVFMLKYVSFNHDFVADTSYVDTLQTMVQRNEVDSRMMAMVSMSNLMFDTRGAETSTPPSSRELAGLVEDRKEGSIKTMMDLVRKVSYSYKMFVLRTRRRVSIEDIVEIFKHESMHIEDGQTKIDPCFVEALAGDCQMQPCDIETIVKCNRWKDFKSLLEKMQEVKVRSSRLLKYFYLQDVGLEISESNDIVDSIRDNFLFKLLDEELEEKEKGTSKEPLEFFNEISIDLYKDCVRLVRFDLRNNGNYGFLDMSKISYTTEKCTVFIDILFPSLKTKKTVVHKYKIDLVKNFILRPKDNSYQNKQYFKKVKMRDVIKKINQCNIDNDLLNDYDICIFYERENKQDGIQYTDCITVEDRITAILDSSCNSIPRVKAVFIDNRRFTDKNYIKVIYSHKTNCFTEETNGFLVYVPEDNDQKVGEFVKYFVGKYFEKDEFMNSSQGHQYLLDNILFSLYSNLTFTSDPTVFDSSLGMELNSTFTDIYTFLHNHHDIDNNSIINCFLKNPLVEKYGEMRYSPQSIENFLKLKIEVSSQLTDLLDYLIHNHQFDSREAPSSILYGIKSNENLARLPPTALLPSVLIVCITNINNMIEIDNDLGIEVVDEKVCREVIGISREYSLIGMICRKKQQTPSSPLVYYPVYKVPNSPTEDVIGYLPKETRVPFSKLKKEQIDYVILERKTFNRFSS